MIVHVALQWGERSERTAMYYCTCTAKCRVNAHGCLHDFDQKMGGGGVCLVQATFGV